MGERIIYTGAFRFPEGDAAAARVLGVGKTLRDMGYSVEFAGWEESERQADLGADGIYRHQGFPYRSMGDLRRGDLPPVKRLFRFLTAGQRTLDWLGQADLGGVSSIIAYHGGVYFLTKLSRFCRKRRIRLLFDCTEWYDPGSVVGGPFGPVALDSELRMRLIYPRIGKGIVVSSFLRDHYRARGCDVALVPPTIDLSDPKWSVRKKGQPEPPPPLRIVYAGIPGKKDDLLNAMSGLANLRSMGIAVELELLGPGEAQVRELLASRPGLPAEVWEMIRVRGLIPQNQVPARVAKAHYSLLMRPNKRYADAGFSTKFVESLAAGVPVMATATSDIGRLVTHGVQGFVLRDSSADAFVTAVLEARRITDGQHDEMRAAARTLASSHFNYQAYVGDTDLIRVLRR